jgi:2-C-methyl-D-erythritol 4-phosphate cytidylyltransferase
MGMDKLAWPLHGVPVLRRTLDSFLASPSIHSLVVVCPPARWKLLGGGFAKPVTRVDGGAERHESVAMGLAAIDPAADFVAVHDGARPLLSPEDIDACVAAAVEFRAASLARRATETMKRADEHGFCIGAVDRRNLWCMETPQVCETGLLRDACRRAVDLGLCLTDEVSALQEAGIGVKLIESRHPNLKITTPADLALAEALTR